MILNLKNYKFKITITLLIIYIFTLIGQANVKAEITYTPEKFSVLSQAAYLVNMDTDTLIYKKNETQQLPPASLAKIMTAIIVLETLPADDLDKSIENYTDIMTDPYWVQQGASVSGFYPGEITSIRTMLYALLIQSACDTADVLAYYTATTYLNGDINTFVQKMNEKAKELGANNTNFVNTHGLDADGQYTTAYDMYLMTKHALNIPLFSEISQTDVYYVAPTNKHSEKFPLINTNDMIFSSKTYYYEPTIAIKTGTTGINTQNLITMASKNGYKYMAVVLGGKNKDENGQKLYETYKDSINLYKWAFNNFSMRTIITKADTASGVEVKVRLSTAYDYIIGVPQDTIEELVPDNISIEDIKKVSNVPKSIDAPIKEGQVLGTMDLVIDNQVLTSVNIVSTKDIQRSTLLFIFDEIAKFFSNKLVQLVCAIIVLFIVGYILFLVLKVKKSKSSKKIIKKSKSNFNKKYKDEVANYKIEYYNPRNKQNNYNDHYNNHKNN